MSAGLRAATIAVLELPPVGRRPGCAQRGIRPQCSVCSPYPPTFTDGEIEAQRSKLSHRLILMNTDNSKDLAFLGCPFISAPGTAIISLLLVFFSYLGPFYNNQAFLSPKQRGKVVEGVKVFTTK